MSLSFIYPFALVLLVLLPPLWVFALVAQSAHGRIPQANRWLSSLSVRSIVSLTLRLMMMIALILALAGTQLVHSATNLTVVFLIDSSDSVTPTQREWATRYINSALANNDPNNKAAIVVFGQNALVEYVPSNLERLTRLTSIPIGIRTNIAEAIQLGLALFPADTQKRLVLLSDGEENSGRAIEAAHMAALRGVSLDVITLPSESGVDVLIKDLHAPTTAREHQQIVLQATVQSSIATSGQIQVFVDGELAGSQEVTIPIGSTTFPLQVPSGEAGFRRYEVRLNAQGDTQAVNNRAAAFTTVEGPPRILLIASDPSRADVLKHVLESANATVTLLLPKQVPANQNQLKSYTAIVLVDVLAHDVPRVLIEALPIYVREQGGTLMMVGGTQSFGAGGWRRSPVAEVLPVLLERKDTRIRPDLGLVLVIDRSGSMSEESPGGITKLDLAKESVYQAILGMEAPDQIGIVAFDTTADWILPMQSLPSLADVERALSTFNADGGTNIRSGIEPAAQALSSLDARVKHVILLTDGQAESNYVDLIKHMRDNQITITVVSIGSGANPELKQIAELGGGRYYQVNDGSEVLQIFLSETILAVGRDIVEEQVVPMITLQAPIVRGLSKLPALYGYNMTEPRPAARTILSTPDGKTILAQGQYGLGQGIAWTSDLKAQWARDWVTWDQFAHFGSNLLDMMLPPEQAEGLTMESRVDDTQAIFDVIVPQSGQSQGSVRISGRLLDPDDKGVSLNFVQVAANRYRAIVPVDTPGVYLVQAAVLDSTSKPMGTMSSGVVVNYSPEYRTRGANPTLLSDLASATQGRISPDATAVFDPTSQSVGVVQEMSLPLLWFALLLLPLDVAMRRLLLRKQDFIDFLGFFRKPFYRKTSQPASSDTTMVRLFAAKERARKKKDE